MPSEFHGRTRLLGSDCNGCFKRADRGRERCLSRLKSDVDRETGRSSEQFLNAQDRWRPVRVEVTVRRRGLSGDDARRQSASRSLDAGHDSSMDRAGCARQLERRHNPAARPDPGVGRCAVQPTDPAGARRRAEKPVGCSALCSRPPFADFARACGLH